MMYGHANTCIRLTMHRYPMHIPRYYIAACISFCTWYFRTINMHNASCLGNIPKTQSKMYGKLKFRFMYGYTYHIRKKYKHQHDTYRKSNYSYNHCFCAGLDDTWCDTMSGFGRPSSIFMNGRMIPLDGLLFQNFLKL